MAARRNAKATLERPFLSASFPPGSHIVDGNTGQNSPQYAKRLPAARRIDDRIQEEHHRRKDEKRRNHGVQRNPERRSVTGTAAENENGSDCHRVERNYRRDECVGKLIERSEKHED